MHRPCRLDSCPADEMQRTLATLALAMMLGCAHQREPNIRPDLAPLLPQIVYNVSEATQACALRYSEGCIANRIGGCKCGSYTVPYGVWMAGR